MVATAQSTFLSLCQFRARDEEFLAAKIHFVQSRQVDTQSGRKPLKLTSVRGLSFLIASKGGDATSEDFGIVLGKP